MWITLLLCDKCCGGKASKIGVSVCCVAVYGIACHSALGLKEVILLLRVFVFVCCLKFRAL